MLVGVVLHRATWVNLFLVHTVGVRGTCGQPTRLGPASFVDVPLLYFFFPLLCFFASLASLSRFFVVE